MMSSHLPSRKTPDKAASPMQSLIAAAQVVTSARVRKQTATGGNDEQRRAWEHYDAVGELRAVANSIGRSMSKARLVAARDPLGASAPVVIEPNREREEGEDELRAIEIDAANLMADLGSSVAGQQQMLQRLGVHLFVGGESWIVGILKNADDDPEDPDAERLWLVCSPNEISSRQDGEYKIDLGGGNKRTVSEAEAIVTRVWNPHPRKWWEADSPTLSASIVLDELLGLSLKVQADIDSRLAGNGLLVLPNSVEFTTKAKDRDEDEEGEDDFFETFIEVMTEPIEDRNSAAAVVPFVIRVPDEVVGLVQHLTFSTPLDAEARELRVELIRRLALSLDAEPETLLGMSDANHWCVDDTTEAFTRDRGWVSHDALKAGDVVRALDHSTGLAVWTTVTDIYRADVVDEPMRLLDGHGHSSLTTAQHRWPVVGRKSGTRDWRTTDSLTEDFVFVTGAPSGDLPSTPKYDDAFVDLVAWYWTEGSMRGATQGVTIAQSHTVNADRVAMIRSALTSLYGAPFEGLSNEPAWYEVVQSNESAHGGPVTVFRLNAAAAAPLHTVAPDKRCDPAFVDALTAAQLDRFIDISCRGDGHHYRQGVFDIWQRDAAALDAFERAVMLSGRAYTYREDSDGYVVRPVQSTTAGPVRAARAQTGAAIDEVVEYTGVVWCPVTETGTWLMRRRGRVAYTGNSLWGVTEITLQTHVQPPLALTCDALTIGYLRPGLLALGHDETDVDEMVAWYDASEIVLRPKRGEEAQALFDRGVIDDRSLRAAHGYGQEDAPTEEAIVRNVLLELVRGAPTLAPLLLPIIFPDLQLAADVAGEGDDIVDAAAPTTPAVEQSDETSDSESGQGAPDDSEQA